MRVRFLLNLAWFDLNYWFSWGRSRFGASSFNEHTTSRSQGKGIILIHLSYSNPFNSLKTCCWMLRVISVWLTLGWRRTTSRVGRGQRPIVAPSSICVRLITTSYSLNHSYSTSLSLCAAPEMIEGVPYGREADWWGLGILIYDMLAGGVRFHH